MRSILICISASLFMMSGAVGAATVDCATVMSTPSMLCHPYLSASQPDNTDTCIKQCTINMAPQVGPGSYGGDVVNAGSWGQFNNTCPPRYTLLGFVLYLDITPAIIIRHQSLTWARKFLKAGRVVRPQVAAQQSLVYREPGPIKVDQPFQVLIWNITASGL